MLARYIALIPGFALSVSLPLLTWMSFSSAGNQGTVETLDNCLFWSILLIVPYVAGALLSFVVTLFPKYRKNAAQVAVGMLCCAIALLASLYTAGRIQRSAIEKLVANSAPLVVAIDQYQKKNIHPPGKLDDLVPAFLPSVPQTGMGAFPNYKFMLLNKEDRPADWELTVSFYNGDLLKTWDELIYYPTQKYENLGFDLGWERIGDWAFAHFYY